MDVSSNIHIQEPINPLTHYLFLSRRMDRKLLYPALHRFLLRLGIVLGIDLIQIHLRAEQVAHLVTAVEDLAAVRPVKDPYEFPRQCIDFYRA
jgi:hypothetical protein